MKSQLSELDQYMDLVRFELNNSVRADDQDLLMFNRVPKVGSQTMLRLLELLSKRNNFIAYKDSFENVRKNGENTFVSCF